MFARKTRRIIDNNYRHITIIVILILLFTNPLNCVYTSRAAESFYDYVNEERRKEIGGDSDAEKRLLEDIYEKRQRALVIGRVAAILLAIIWIVAVYFLLDTEKVEYKTITGDVDLSPVEISAIYNMKEISMLDLVATLFDLTVRGLLSISEYENEMRVYLNEDIHFDSPHKLEGYEDFLIGWFIKKIGGGEYFSFNKLWDFLSAKSRAVEFDIDYDIWVDEVREFLKGKQIYDENIESRKLVFNMVGAIYAILGLILLYLTGTTAAILLFGITFLSIRFPIYRKRSRNAEEKYKSLLGLKARILTDIAASQNVEDSKKWDKYFVYSIPLGITELFLGKYGEYERYYQRIVENLDKAIIYADDIVHSSF